MNFCPNCGFKLPVEGAKFCPECGTGLQSSTAQHPASAAYAAKEEKSDRAFELLKEELSESVADLAKNIADSLLEKWKTSGKYPKRVGGALDVLVERALPIAIKAKLGSVAWENVKASETSEGKLETAVSTSFPVEIETGIPLVGKIAIKRVRLTMKGDVDVVSKEVSQVRVGALDLL